MGGNGRGQKRRRMQRRRGRIEGDDGEEGIRGGRGDIGWEVNLKLDCANWFG